MLLPYYLMRYEDDCREAGKGEAGHGMEVFFRECQDVIDRLLEACAGKEQQYLFQTLADLILEVAKYLAPDYAKGKVEAMGGTVIKTRAQVILEQGISQGISQGILQGVSQGETQYLISQVCKKLKKGKTPEVIAEEVEEDLETVLPICEVAWECAPEYDVKEIYGRLKPGQEG